MKKITLKFPANNFTDVHTDTNKWDKIHTILPRTTRVDKLLSTLLDMRKEFVLAYAECSQSYLIGSHSPEYIKERVSKEIERLLSGEFTKSAGFICPMIVWLAEGVTKENVAFHYSDGEKHLSEVLQPVYAIGQDGQVEAYFEIQD